VVGGRKIFRKGEKKRVEMERGEKRVEMERGEKKGGNGFRKKPGN
jgi:hypothetical protein